MERSLMPTTPNYGWNIPADTDYVTNGALAMRTLGNEIDSTLDTQIDNLDADIAALPQGIKAYQRSTTELVTPSSTTEVLFMGTGAAFTPIAGRLYEITITVGRISKKTAAGGVGIFLRKGTGGSLLTTWVIEFDSFDTIDYSTGGSYSWTQIFTSTQLGTTSFTPVVYANVNNGSARLENTSTTSGGITVKDIGLA
jgi:hypothetical protein